MQYDRLGSGKLVKDDVVVCIRGSLGKHGRFPFDKGAIASSLVILRSVYNEQILSEFIMMYLDSPLFFDEIKKYDNGTAQPNLAAKSLEQFFVPLPPLSEQRRIISLIEKMDSYIAEYDKKESEIEFLQKLFPEQLKKSILQEAVQGKLVPQDPTDEPASVLLERIREEKTKLIKEGKIKKDKNESIIFRRDNSYYEKSNGVERCIDAELPFDIPDSWEWCRLCCCVDVRDGTHDSPKYVQEGIPLITSKNLHDGFLDMRNAKFISQEDHEKISQRSRVDNNDILFAMIGSIGNPVLYNGEDNKFSIKNMALFKHIHNGMLMKYVYWWLFFSQYAMKTDSSGGVQSFVSLNYLRNYFIPVPPLAEQLRIVTSIERLLAMIKVL